ncbi:hypothetical protein TNCV_296521 [Trichonephila clavipes]|nr:hypothetical protein TNCV_296521 [Trichonephila clavipes]
MEYASSIWTHAAKAALEKLDSFQARAAEGCDGLIVISTNVLLGFFGARMGKGLKTFDKYPKDDFVFTYTDGSSDEKFSNGATLAALQEIGVLFSSENFYMDNIEQSARTVIWAHGTASFGPIME